MYLINHWYNSTMRASVITKILSFYSRKSKENENHENCADPKHCLLTFHNIV